MHSLDFWRFEEGLIRENWGLVALLDVYTQIGVDVFRRMEEFTYDLVIEIAFDICKLTTEFTQCDRVLR